MHLLIIGIVIAAVLYWVFTQRGRNASSEEGWGGANAETSSKRFAFIANGKLFYADQGQAPREIHSPHVQAAMDRLERSRERNAWKEGTTFSVRAGGQWREGPGREMPLFATSVQFAPDGRLLYFR